MSVPLNRREDWSQIKKECEVDSAAEVARRHDIPPTTLRSALTAASHDGFEKPDEPGYVYLLSNPCFSLMKIGRSFDVPDLRAQQLSRPTGVPENFKVELFLYTSKSHAVERALHRSLNNLRPNHSREFFNVTVDQMRLLFRCLDEGPPDREMSA
jgi:hypothetical protein